MANRERWEGKLDLTYLPSERWNLNMNLLWQEDDFDKSDLGLTERLLGARRTLAPAMSRLTTFSGTVYAGYDRLRGGPNQPRVPRRAGKKCLRDLPSPAAGQ